MLKLHLNSQCIYLLCINRQLLNCTHTVTYSYRHVTGSQPLFTCNRVHVYELQIQISPTRLRITRSTQTFHREFKISWAFLCNFRGVNSSCSGWMKMCLLMELLPFCNYLYSWMRQKLQACCSQQACFFMVLWTKTGWGCFYVY